MAVPSDSTPQHDHDGSTQKMLKQHQRDLSAAQNALLSTQQHGGITAHTVNITYAASAVMNTRADPSKKPWWPRTWLVISGAVAFGAAVLQILDDIQSHRRRDLPTGPRPVRTGIPRRRAHGRAVTLPIKSPTEWGSSSRRERP